MYPALFVLLLNREAPPHAVHAMQTHATLASTCSQVPIRPFEIAFHASLSSLFVFGFGHHQGFLSYFLLTTSFFIAIESSFNVWQHFPADFYSVRHLSVPTIFQDVIYFA